MDASDKVTARTDMKKVCMDSSNSGGYGDKSQKIGVFL